VPIGAIAIGVVVLAVVGLGVWLWPGRPASDANPSNDAPATAEQDRVRDLVTRFADRGDWSDARLVMLNTDLLELGGARLSQAAADPWFQRFVDEVRQRLKEQQALASAPLSADNSPLAALAVTLGLNLNAPDAAIRIATLPPPQLPDAASASRPGVKTSSTSAASPAVHNSPGIGDSARAPLNAQDSASQVAAAAGATAPAPNGNAITGAQTGATPATSAADTSASARPATSASSNTSAEAAAREGACHTDLIGTRRPFCHDILPSGAEGPPLALIPAGAFDMGSTAAAEEQPVHHVTIRAPFAISVYEVSQGEFKQFCSQADRPCPKQPWSGDDYPMVNVTWDEARAYTAWLSSVTHQHYSLPTEAQWEYAARAGRTGLFPSGDALSPTDAHYSMLAKQTAAARRSQKFNANAFRLMHTLGNVREWVEDAWSPTFAAAPADGSAAAVSQSIQQRVARGGSYADGAARLRLSFREGLPAGTRDAMTGFRIVRELP
jgi:formylglycine-generating enzyme required for sulfatase activity